MSGRKFYRKKESKVKNWRSSTPEPPPQEPPLTWPCASSYQLEPGSIYHKINMPAGRVAAINKGLIQLKQVKHTIDTNNNPNNSSVGVYNSDDSFTAGYEKMKNLVCICDRPKSKILCPTCGYSTYGRIRRQCFLHCRLTYLLEMDVCPRCHSKDLMEVKSPEKVD